jgi:NAD(P)-dependent dehydrogenase (short-subunit alcohol dehydrogenase family)
VAAAAGSRAGIRTFAEGVALVTGGASGIGAALCRELARRGALVVLADREAHGARAEAGRIAAAGGRAEAATLDVRDAAAVEALVAGVFSRHGRLDHLFNNAGIGVGGEVRHLALDAWRDAVEVNLMGVVHGVQAAWPRMIEQGFGHVVNTASSAAFGSGAMTAPYTATKVAVVALSRASRAPGTASSRAPSARASFAPPSSRTADATGGSARSTQGKSRRSGSGCARWTRTRSRGRPSTTWRGTGRSSSTQPGGGRCAS